MGNLDEKVVIVTGGSSGIGRVTAHDFAQRGAKVLVTARGAPALERSSDDHPNIFGLVADVTAPDAAAHTVEEVVRRWGQLDIVVNNAGAGAILQLADATVDRISTIFAVNVIGPSLLVKAALPHLIAARGAVINVSSTFGHKPVAGLSHYAASKAALEHLTRCWALELAPHGVRVNAVAAGPTRSGALTGMMGLSPDEAASIEQNEREQIPLSRRGEPKDVAGWIVRLAGPESDWITGQVVSVDGGLSVT
jgi:NAD(P)-dependent dehydrogenase (short-subunit alcohol dehydrogenase family)